MYDVIVIGAGPSGCCAAKALAENGFKVLIAEKFTLPRYKSCSGQLIRKTVNLVRKYFGEEVPVSAMCAPEENKGMILTDDKGQAYRFEQDGLNVWRSSFDKWLADKAVQSGAELRDGTAVVSCVEQDGAVSVTLKGKKVYTEKARFVIDCEGVVGAVKRKLLNREYEYIKTYQTFNRGSIDLDLRYFYAYLQPELSEYDAWFNVKDNQLVLGISVVDSGKIGHYYDRFIEYMKKNHNLRIDKQLKVDKWLMPKVRPGCEIDYGTDSGRVLFAGECAGFLNPMGEGISAGHESGFCAAQAVLQNPNNPQKAIKDYIDSTADLHAYMGRQWNFIAGISGTFRHMKIKVNEK